MYIGHKIAIIAEKAGTTRDICDFEFNDKKRDLTYILSDSWGLDFWSKQDEIANDIIERTILAIDESNLIIWLIEYDIFDNLDEKILKLLRQKKYNNYIIVANKSDNDNKKMESYSLAWKGEIDFFPVSVSHNSWIEQVKIFVAKFLKNAWLNFKKEDHEDSSIKLALIGRPNVWKSSILNALVWKDRVMVKDQAWTTRDSIDTKFSYNDEEFILIDTSWIRRLSKIWTRNIENWSVMRTERSLKRADITCVIIDWYEWIVGQDLSIINKSLEEKKWIIVVVNKWDKVLAKPWIDKEHMMQKYIKYLQEKIAFMPWVSVIFTSAIEKKRVNEVLNRASEIRKERLKRIKTSIFNEFIEQAVYKHPPTWNKKSHSPKIYYWSQVDTNPPKFILTVNNPEHFHFSYKRYIENRIRDNFWFNWTPIIIEYRWRGKYKDLRK